MLHQKNSKLSDNIFVVVVVDGRTWRIISIMKMDSLIIELVVKIIKTGDPNVIILQALRGVCDHHNKS